MSQHRLRVPEPEGLGSKRTNSEDNLYLAVLRASEGKKGSWHSFWAGALVTGRVLPVSGSLGTDWGW